MRRLTCLTASFLGLCFIAACRGEEATDAAPASDLAVTGGEELSCYVARGTAEESVQRPSPLRETRFSLGSAPALLCYGAPSSNGRAIMGGLLVYGQAERIGANEATTLHLTAPATVGGVSLQPGSYSIYAIAGPEQWQFFVNSNWQRWGIPISPEVRATEVGSFSATPEPLGEMVETLRYRFEPVPGGPMGNVVLEWERTRVSFHVMGGV